MSAARDFVGYANDPPHAGWPGDARIAVQFALNYEEGAEASVADGDDRNEVGLTEAVGGRIPKGQRDLAFESLYEYGSRVGVWRVLDQFRERRIPLTVFGCAVALERNPAVAQAIRDSQYDVCCHGWRWIEPFRLSEAEERAHIARAVASIAATTGERPVGWYCRYGAGENTRRLLVQEGGFLYDSDAYNDELPYWVRVEERAHLVVPYTMDANDAKFGAPASFGTGDDFLAYLRGTFDQLYHEGAKTARIMSVGLHPRLSGRPARARALGQFLDYARSFDRVWFCRRVDIARHWIEAHPAPAIPT